MSRLELKWFNLTQNLGQDLCLKIPLCEVYSPIIDRAFPNIHHIGWQQATKGTCYTYIKEISDDDRERLNDFLECLQHIRCLTLTEHLGPYFSNELDEAYALDFNFVQDVYPLSYTECGDLEHRAKEERNDIAITDLAQRLSDFITKHPTFSRADVLCAVPPRPSKDFHLPVQLVSEIGKMLSKNTGLDLTSDEHRKLKSLPVAEKISELRKVFHLNEPVSGKSILMIDDLYQSGVTAGLWHVFLKDKALARSIVLHVLNLGGILITHDTPSLFAGAVCLLFAAGTGYWTSGHACNFTADKCGAPHARRNPRS